MKYFKDVKTKEEARKLYTKLAREYHPDLHPEIDVAIMKSVNVEYEEIIKRLSNNETLNNDSETPDFDVVFRDIIDAFIDNPNITIEIIGTWIWITGETYHIKDELKNHNMRYAPKKKAWFYNGTGVYAGRSSKQSLESIRDKYGSQQVSKNRDSYKFIK